MRVGNGSRLAFNAIGNEAGMPTLPFCLSKPIIPGEDILLLFSTVIRSAHQTLHYAGSQG
jgi:hypothetical protein